MENEIRKCIIIGSGPAGYTAAIYAARADMQPLVITGMEPGGQLTTTTEVDNFPGYPKGITGPELMEELKQQAERFGTEVVFDYVSEVNFEEGDSPIHTLKTTSGKEFKAQTVIVSTGASAKYLGLEDEKKYAGGGVSACATCDGFFYKGQDVVVVGGGDTAAEEATYLAKLCRKVWLLVRKDEMRASKAMQHRVFNTPNLEVLFNSELVGIKGENNLVEVAEVRNNQSKEIMDVPVKGIFIAIGHKPNTDIFKNILDMHESGYLKVQAGSTRTNIKGVFAAGDVADSIYRQAVTAAGTGCMAALDAERYHAEHF